MILLGGNIARFISLSIPLSHRLACLRNRTQTCVAIVILESKMTIACHHNITHTACNVVLDMFRLVPSIIAALLLTHPCCPPRVTSLPTTHYRTTINSHLSTNKILNQTPTPTRMNFSFLAPISPPSLCSPFSSTYFSCCSIHQIQRVHSIGRIEPPMPFMSQSIVSIPIMT